MTGDLDALLAEVDERIFHAQDIDNLPMLEALESAREQILEAKRKKATK